jgi:hypothetical protein
MDDVAYGIDGGYEGIYDGVIVWVLNDGRRINRFAGVKGMERRAAAVDAWLATAEGDAK